MIVVFFTRFLKTDDCSSLQTKELIAEIELLEEEIANREQHVLTLYRSIFDQCMSGPPSGQSSGISSPAHAKTITARTRRQPSIISSAFCSSKKLPLQPFHITESLSESGRTKNTLKAKIKHPSFSSETLDSSHSTSFPPDPKKVTQQLQANKEFSQQAQITCCKHSTAIHIILISLLFEKATLFWEWRLSCPHSERPPLPMPKQNIRRNGQMHGIHILSSAHRGASRKA
jgi:hypothetical protein